MKGRLVTRRNFCAGMAAIGVSLAFCGCSPKGSADERSSGSEATADIVVVGSGLAGGACARSAAQNGAHVILVDKAPTNNFAYRPSMGLISVLEISENEQDWFFESDAGTDTMQDFLARYDEVTKVGGIESPYPDYDRLKQVMQDSCEVMQWVSTLGIEYQLANPRTNADRTTDMIGPDLSAEKEGMTGGEYYAQKIAAEFESLQENLELMYSTEALRLLVEDGKVVGLRASCGGDEFDIRAKAVVFATGGFGANADYCEKLVPQINRMGFQFLGNSYNTGDGMTMASAVDAALYEDCWIVPSAILPAKPLIGIDESFSLLNDPPRWATSIEGGRPSEKLIVDGAGKRFVNEASSINTVVTRMADLDSGPYYTLFDASSSDVVSILEKGVGTDFVFKADTIEELSQKASMDGLSTSFATYQAAAKSGKDPECGKAAEQLVQYQEGPFYLVEYTPCFVATLGGIKTNADHQVIREDDEPVDGLYAIGEATHRFLYNRSFVDNCSNIYALHAGYKTGKALAERR